MLSHQRRDMAVRNIVAPQSVAGGRPVEIPEAVGLAWRPNMGKADELGHVLDGCDRAHRLRQDPRMSGDADVAQKRRPEQIEEVGSLRQALDQLPRLFVGGVILVHRIDEDVRVERRAHPSASSRSRTASLSSRSTSGFPSLAVRH